MHFRVLPLPRLLLIKSCFLAPTQFPILDSTRPIAKSTHASPDDRCPLRTEPTPSNNTRYRCCSGKVCFRSEIFLHSTRTLRCTQPYLTSRAFSTVVFRLAQPLRGSNPFLRRFNRCTSSKPSPLSAGKRPCC
jgi:hypothetical protein